MKRSPGKTAFHNSRCRIDCDVGFCCPHSAVPRELQTSDSLVHFTVMDWDMIGANDFMGEAFFSFQQIPRGDSASAVADVDQIHLQLSKPSDRSKTAFNFTKAELLIAHSFQIRSI